MMYTEQLAHIEGYDATVEAHRFCYAQLLKAERMYEQYVLVHGHDDHAVRLRATVNHYQRNTRQLDEKLQIERAARINGRTIAEQMAAERAAKKVQV